MTNAQLLALSGGVLAELRERGVIRTGNAPAGDLAERLVAEATGGTLAGNSQKSWDIELPPPEPGGVALHLQVKARVVFDPANLGQRQVSAFRSWDFDSVMFVLFDPFYAVRIASLVPAEIVKATSKAIVFTASDKVSAADALLAKGEDWTERLRSLDLWNKVRESPSDA